MDEAVARSLQDQRNAAHERRAQKRAMHFPRGKLAQQAKRRAGIMQSEEADCRQERGASGVSEPVPPEPQFS